MTLTPKQLRILTLIRDMRLTRGYSPTLQELADEVGVSKVTVHEHIQALVRKKALVRQSSRARSLVLEPSIRLPHESATRLPFVGHIAAGVPIEAVESQRFLDLEELFAASKSAKAGERFVLRVRGDSMIDEQIRDGDYVVVEKRANPRNGQTVVALMVSGEATLKKFFREKNQIRLEAANEKYKPILVTDWDLKIQGVVIGVIRRYES